jgi:ADP-ribose pyrophosphatase YjhB (NUDIX family)
MTRSDFKMDMQMTHMMKKSFPSPAPMRPALQWLLHRWFLLTRAMTLGVRAVVLDDEGRVLLVEHGYVAGWHLPGGGVEIGETLILALAKELREEAGVALTGPAQLHGLFLNDRLGRRDHVAVFVVRDFVWNGPPPATREIRRAAFFAVDALPDGTTAATRRRLAEVLEDAPPCELW